jgi:hypothetical protein
MRQFFADYMSRIAAVASTSSQNATGDNTGDGSYIEYRGWALPHRKKPVRLTDKQKNWLTDLFVQGERTRRKITPNKAADLMKTVKRDHKKIFHPKEYLKNTQIMGFFSRLARNRTQVMTSTTAAAEEESDDENEDELTNDVTEQEIDDIADEIAEGGGHPEEPSAESPEPVDNTEKSDAIELGSYYAVYYSKKFYIGKVLKACDDETYKMEYIHSKSANSWIKPKREDISTEERDDLFFGPVFVHGAGDGPFNIDEDQLKEISKRYKELKKKYRKN